MTRQDVTVHRFDDDLANAFTQADALLAAEIADLHRRLDRTIIIGLCGPQGSGKSSTAARLVARLGLLGLTAVSRSLDDFYLTKSERRILCKEVHPLLETRGVPGTHDLKLLRDTLRQLASVAQTDELALPTFDKTRDDRAPVEDWPVFCGRADIIILEGWCVGARPQPPECLHRPINMLEEQEDPDAVWRAFVNEQLADDYAALFADLDLSILLKAPSFDCIFGWRAEQEAKLTRPEDGSRPAMTEGELRRFIAHYERVTRWLMEDEPADLVVEIGADRKPLNWFRR